MVRVRIAARNPTHDRIATVVESDDGTYTECMAQIAFKMQRRSPRIGGSAKWVDRAWDVLVQVKPQGGPWHTAAVFEPDHVHALSPRRRGRR
jgi:hypothetical protein